jgi:hypothetical protein
MSCRKLSSNLHTLKLIIRAHKKGLNKRQKYYAKQGIQEIGCNSTSELPMMQYLERLAFEEQSACLVLLRGDSKAVLIVFGEKRLNERVSAVVIAHVDNSYYSVVSSLRKSAIRNLFYLQNP